MDLSRVKMIVTDMDGTLLDTQSRVSDRFFELFHELKEHEVHFVAASGRQYSSIFEKLESIYREITIVAENGGYIKNGTLELGSIVLDRSYVTGMIPTLRKIEGLYTVLCGKESAYIEDPDPVFSNILREYYSKYDRVEDLFTVDYDEFFKVAVYHFDGSESHVYPHLKHLERDLQVKVSGKNWIDISDKKANKGAAVKVLQERLDIGPNETMVFGDFNNDLEMINEAYFSYAMENAHPNVKKAARFKTSSNDEQGVERVLEKLLEAKKSSLTG